MVLVVESILYIVYIFLAILLERINVHNALHCQFLWTWLLCASRFLTLLQVPINSHSVRTAEFAKLLNVYIER